MKLIFLFLAAFTLITTTAMPMQPPQESSSAPSPDHVPKVDFGYRAATRNNKAAAKDIIINHYKDLEPGNEQKKARLAFVQSDWRDGIRLDDHHRQYLNFNYHREEHPYSDKIGETVTLSRDRPPPESHFISTVPYENKAEIAGVMNNKYKALPSEQAKRVRSMKAHGDWSDGPGFREETQMTFHHDTIPTKYNNLGDPVTIYRPMTLLIDSAVSEKEIPVITKRIREEHEKLEEGHPLKQANYGVVNDGWHREKTDRASHVGATLYKVKNQLSGKAEEDYQGIGYFDVSLGSGRSAIAGSSTTSKRKRKS